MSEKGKARKLEDRNKPVHSHPGSLPAMGGPGMVPHHNYGLTSEGYHSGGRLYRQGLVMGQSMPMGPTLARGLSNDLGPPIFMPSLNLGTPKSIAPPPHPNSKLKQPTMSSAAAFMSSYPQAGPLSAFHSATPPHKPYIPPASSSANPPSVSTSLAKPAMGGPAPDRESSQPSGGAKVTTSQGMSKLLGSVESVKGEGLACMLSQSYCNPPVLTSPAATSNLSKMLMGSSPPQDALAQDQDHSCPVTYLEEPFTARSPVMVPVAPPTPSTCGQASSNVTFADSTRMDRPPQPSAPYNPPPGAVPSQQAKELNQQAKGLTTAEVASNIIISNPGLTGKHIAAMTNCSQQPSPLHPNTAYSSPISSAELLPGPSSLLNMPLNQHTGWGFTPQHNSNHIFHNTLSPPVSVTTTAGGVDLPSQHSNGGGLRSRLESAVSSAPPHSPLGTGGEQALLSSPSQLNSSPRPRILRGKRPMDGNWKLDGQSNSIHKSPGSPHRTKLANLKKSALASPSSGVMEPRPQSPDGMCNHVGGALRGEVGSNVRGEGAEFSGSPRKKPRKQNVVANDDQYASNVPDTLLPLTQHSDDSMLTEESHSGSVCEDRGSPGDGRSKELEIRYLAQLRKSPYPINGVYKLWHRVAHNHFRRYTDVRHRAALPTSVYDLANHPSSQYRASGWKLLHFNSQLEEVGKVETDCLLLMQQVQELLAVFQKDATCLLDTEAMRTTKDLVQGNIDRCNRVKGHVESTTRNMFMVLDQRSQVVDVLDKYSNFKSHYSSISPSLSSSSSSHQQKSQS